MAYSGVTKPAVGDPTKQSTIDAMIDNQDHFNGSIASANGFTADKTFESTPASGPAVGWNLGTGAGTAARSNTASDPNAGGEYCMKFSGSAGDSKYIETDLFPIDELRAYIVGLGCKVDDSGDKFTVSFITVERDGSTSVQTVVNPVFNDGSDGINNTTFQLFEWVVDGGTNARFAKIKIEWVCNGTAASAGYVDSILFDVMDREVRFMAKEFNNGGARTLETYCPRFCKTEFTRIGNGGADDGDDHATQTNWLTVVTGPSGETDQFNVTNSNNSTYYADNANKIKITGDNEGDSSHCAIVYTPRWLV